MANAPGKWIEAVSRGLRRVSGAMGEAADQAERLCRQCGLCCDGTIFGHVPVAGEERERIAALDFAIAPFGDQSGFAQPCPRYTAGCCTVYADRPAVCRSYACVTLRALATGDIGLAEAEGRVAQARDAVRKAVDTAPGAKSLAEARARWTEEPDSRLSDPQTARLHFLLAALDLLLDRHFRTERQRSVTFMTPD